MWRQHRLRTEVRLKVLENGIAFYRFLGLKGLIVNDIILTGSNAAYNYTLQSDLDVHLLVGFFARTHVSGHGEQYVHCQKDLMEPKLRHHDQRSSARTLCGEHGRSRERQWRLQRVAQSLAQNTDPHTPPAYDDIAILSKAEVYADEIDALLAGEPTIAMLTQMLQRLHELRQNGLLSGGEFSIENLTYKTLRAIGYIQKLYAELTKLRDQHLSVGNRTNF